MKKLPFYIVLSVAVAAIVALVVSTLKRKSNTGAVAGSSGAASQDTAMMWVPVNKKLNPSTNLYAGAKNARNETAALQNLINLYNGQNVVSVSGDWDEATGSQVNAIAGKGNTNLYEFAYKYLVPKIGQNQAMAIYSDLLNGKA